MCIKDIFKRTNYIITSFLIRNKKLLKYSQTMIHGISIPIHRQRDTPEDDDAIWRGESQRQANIKFSYSFSTINLQSMK